MQGKRNAVAHPVRDRDVRPFVYDATRLVKGRDCSMDDLRQCDRIEIATAKHVGRAGKSVKPFFNRRSDFLQRVIGAKRL